MREHPADTRPEMMSKATESETIFYIHSGDDLYGSDIVLLDLVRGLDRSRFTPWVFLPSDSAHVGKLSAELARYDIPYRHIPFPVLRRRYFTPFGGIRFLRETLTGLKQLRALAREKQASLIHTNTLAVPIGALLARSLRVPHVWHVHEILVKPRFVRKFLHFLVARFSDVGICISEPVRAHVAEDQPTANLVIVPNGIREPEFSSDDPLALRASIGLPLDTPLIGTIGRISTWKGQTVLAHAAALVKQSGRKVHFMVMGGVFDGDVRPLNALKDVIRAHQLEDFFSIRDFQPDARRFLPAIDIFVLPSILPEPFGLVVIEAMAAARPVVATNHGGPRDIVVQNQTGLLVAPDDPAALAQALVALLDNPELRQQFGIAGRERMLNYFGLDSFISNMSRLYNDLLQRSGTEFVTNSTVGFKALL